MIRSHEKESINFDFYDSCSYQLIQAIVMSRFHFNVGTFTGDLRTKQENDFMSQVAVLYTSQKHVQPFVLVKFN